MKTNWAGISLYHTVLRQVGSEEGFKRGNEEKMNKISGKRGGRNGLKILIQEKLVKGN